MRSLHLPSSYFPDSLGGTERYVEHLVAALRQQHHEAFIAWPTVQQHLPAGCHALPVPKIVDRRALYAKVGSPTAPAFAALLTELAPDIVHFHAFTLGASLDHARACTRLGVPYVVTFHTPSMLCPRGTWMWHGREPCDGRLDPRRCSECVSSQRYSSWLAHLAARSPVPAAPLARTPLAPHLALPSLLKGAEASAREFYGGAKRIVACAEFVKERLLSNGLGHGRIEVLRQGLPGSHRRRALRLPLRRAGKPLVLGFLGRIYESKGPDLLVRAVELLRGRGLPVNAELVGPIPEPDARAVRELLASSPWATHLGTKTGAELTSWLESIDALVVPSRWLETGPLTLLEAWDVGTPVLGTKLGGIAEFMADTDQDALLFSLEDAAAIADAVERARNWSAPPPSVSIPGMHELAQATARIYADVTGARCQRA